jgi:hypothetical protein
MDILLNICTRAPAAISDGPPSAAVAAGAMSEPNEIEAQATYQIALAALRLHRNRWTDALSLQRVLQYR